MKLIVQVAMIVFFIASCGHKNKPGFQNDWDKLGMKGRVQTSRVKSFSFENNKVSDPSSYVSSDVLEFNEHGFVTQQSSGVIKKLYTYDEENKKTKVEIFYDGKLTGTYNYKYDQNQNLIEIYAAQPNTNSGEVIKYEYDKNNQLIKKIAQNESGYVYRTEKYNEEGDLTEFMEGDHSHYLYKYNKDKFVVEESQIDKNGIRVSTKSIAPDKKQDNKHINTREYDPGAPNYNTYKIFSEKGKCGKETNEIIDEINGPKAQKEIKLYKECDKKGNWIKIKFPDQKGIMQLRLEREITYFE